MHDGSPNTLEVATLSEYNGRCILESGGGESNMLRVPPNVRENWERAGYSNLDF